MENYGAYWNIKINDIGFPDVLLSNSQGETMGAEIITSRNPQMISVRFHDIFSRAYFEATEKGLNNFLFIIAYSGEALMATIERTVDQIKERYNSTKMEFEVIIGFVNEKNQFIKI